jgi:hypothetical protein
VGGGRAQQQFSLYPSSPQIQELLSPQEPPRPLEAENNSPDSGELRPVPCSPLSLPTSCSFPPP